MAAGCSHHHDVGRSFRDEHHAARSTLPKLHHEVIVVTLNLHEEIRVSVTNFLILPWNYAGEFLITGIIPKNDVDLIRPW